jgi:hypothetical protein
MIRSAMELYLQLLPHANSLLYFVKGDAVERDISDWINVLHKCNAAAKIVFISEVNTYM